MKCYPRVIQSGIHYHVHIWDVANAPEGVKFSYLRWLPMFHELSRGFIVKDLFNYC